MALDKPIPTVMAECCGSCMFFINSHKAPWCAKWMWRISTKEAYVMVYYKCSQYRGISEQTAISTFNNKNILGR